MPSSKVRVFANQKIKYVVSLRVKTVVSLHDITSLYGQPITVQIGTDESARFSVHEELVCASSRFFKNAMSQEWVEGRDRVVSLPMDEPEAFELYLQWLYQGKLPVRTDAPGREGNLEYVQLAHAYVLGDRLQDHNFMDTVLDAMVEKTKTAATDGQKWYPVGPVVRLIYENTPDSSKARQLLIDLYAFKARASWLRDWAEPDDLPKSFLMELAIALLETRNPPTKDDPVMEANTCKYHQHGADSTLCYKNQGKSPKDG